MQVILEGQEALDYLEYAKQQTLNIKGEPGFIKVPQSEPCSRVTPDNFIASAYIADIPQPTVVFKDVPDLFASSIERAVNKKRTYYKWQATDDATINALASSKRPSERVISHILGRLPRAVSLSALKARLNYLGYKLKKGVVCLQD